MNLSIGRWDVSYTLRARRQWWDARRFKTESGWHFVWWKLSLIIEDGTAECHATCAACDAYGDEGPREVSSGDEGWTVCSACCSVEAGRIYVSMRELVRRGVL